MYCKNGIYIDDFLNGKLNENQERILRDHAKNCIECAGRLKEIDKVDKLVGIELKQYPYKSSKEGIMKMVENKSKKRSIASRMYSFRKYGLAAAAVFLLIISINLFKPYLDNTKFRGDAAEKKQSFAIYLVKPIFADRARSYGSWVDNGKNGIKYKEGEKVDLNSLELYDKPIITDKDVLLYHWGDHKIDLTKEFLDKKKFTPVIDDDNRGSEVLGTSSSDAFVVVVNGKRKYSGGFIRPSLGCFQTEATKNQLQISIRDMDDPYNKYNAIQIGSLFRSYDPRDDKDAYDLFKKEGKLVDDYKDKEFNESIAILKAKGGLYQPDLNQVPDKPGKVKGTVHGGGPAPGMQVPGEFETRVEKDKEGNYKVTFTEYWNLGTENVNKHYWIFKVTKYQVFLVDDGGDPDPSQVK